MADTQESHSAVQVISVKDHIFEISDSCLGNLFLQENIRDREVVVISVAGAFRKGKSFLLDFFLRYLSAKYIKKDIQGDDWLGDNNTPLTGFSWRSGADKVTTGISFWSEVFLYDAEDGKKIAIFLMDTQGIFDNESTTKDCAVIFALSTMLSSVQIYNIFGKIQENDLQNLQIFAEYGKLAMEHNGGAASFQKLMFLIRDWCYAYESPYGSIGGAQMLSKILDINEKQPLELQSIRKHIMSCFEKIDCFLMPHPGFEVVEDKLFKGRLKDIRPIFIDQLKSLVPLLLAPENLTVKKIGGKPIKAGQLLPYLMSYFKFFTSTDIPEPKSLFNASVEAQNLSSVSDAAQSYAIQISTYDKPIHKIQDFDDLHKMFKMQTFNRFDAKLKLGGQSLSEPFKERLDLMTERLYEPMRARVEDEIQKNGSANLSEIDFKVLIVRVLIAIFSYLLPFL